MVLFKSIFSLLRDSFYVLLHMWENIFLKAYMGFKLLLCKFFIILSSVFLRLSQSFMVTLSYYLVTISELKLFMHLVRILDYKLVLYRWQHFCGNSNPFYISFGDLDRKNDLCLWLYIKGEVCKKKRIFCSSFCLDVLFFLFYF